MIVVDSSALIAIVLNEPERELLFNGADFSATDVRACHL